MVARHHRRAGDKAVRIGIVEDEAPIARRLERSVRAILDSRVESLTVLPSLAAATEFVRSERLDLVFLDLNLDGRDGFQLLAEAAAARFRTVVVSAHEDQAIRAFEFGVTDFVGKPWTEARLRRAIERATGRGDPATHRARRLASRAGGRIELIEVERVLAVRGADDYSELCLDDGTRRLHEKTLAGLEEILPETFLRVHRSWIVDLARVRSWWPEPGGRAGLEVGELRVPVGRSHRRVTVERLRSGHRPI